MPANYGIRIGDAVVDDETLAKNLQQWEDSVFEAVKRRHPGIESQLKFSTRVPLEKLPVKQQAEFMRQYREMIGLDYTLNTMAEPATTPTKMSLRYLKKNGIQGGVAEKVSGIWSRLDQMRGVGSGNAYARMSNPPGPTGSLINRLYSNINLQFRPKIVQGVSGITDPYNSVAAPSNYFTLGRSSIPTLASLEQQATFSLPKDLTGKRLTIFDIETAGLVKGQIREISYQSGVANADNVLTGATNKTIGMRPHQFARGLMYHGGEQQTLEQFMHSKYDIKVSGMRASHGGDFIKAVTPFLEQIDQSDYLIGHNIAGFDIEQIFTGLAGTKRYKNEQGFAHYVDSMHKKARDITIDTLEMVKNAPNLQGMKIAGALGDEGKLFSISNLLLKTNLATLMGVEELGAVMGWDAKTGTFTKGLHHGDVDTAVTMALVRNVDNLKLQTDIAAGGFKGERRRLVNAIKQTIITSSALTPITNITDRNNILPGLRSHFDAGTSITPLDQLIYSQRDLSKPGDTVDLSPRAMRSRVNIFDRNKHLGMDVVRQKMVENNMPFAGLSMEERQFGTRLSGLTAGVSRTERDAARFGTDALVSRFEMFDPSNIQYNTYSGRSSLPAQILEDMGLLKQGQSMLKLSAVETTLKSDDMAVNLVMNLSNQSEVDQLVDRLKVLAGNEEEFGRVMGSTNGFGNFKNTVLNTGFLDNLRNTGLEGGISVAQLFSDQNTVKGVFDLLRETTISDQLRDKDTFKFALPFMNMTKGEGGPGILRTAGVVLDKFLTGDNIDSISMNVAHAGVMIGDETTGFTGLGRSRIDRVVAEGNARRTATASGDAIAGGLSRFYEDAFRPNAGKVGLGALAGTAALLLYNRKQEKDKYAIATDFRVANDSRRYMIADHVEANMLAGYNGARQQLDPLATASIVSNLNATSIGHSNLGWDRNTNLYGGVL